MFFCFEELLLVVLAVVVRSWFMLFSVFGVLGAIIFLLSGTFYLPLFLVFFIPSSDINKICFAELKKKKFKSNEVLLDSQALDTSIKAALNLALKTMK